MKRLIPLILLVSLLNSPLSAQKLTQKNIYVSTSKTTFLIFDSKVDYFDLGSNDLGLKRAENKDNIIKIKSKVENFKETNLTVMTSNNQYYSFILNYRNNPDTLVYFLQSSTTEQNKQVADIPTASEVKLNPSENLAIEADLSTIDRSFIAGKRKDKMTFLVKGIYVKDNHLFFQTEISNQSNINYEIDFLKFNIKNKKRYKKSISQETEIIPTSVSDASSIIKAGNEPIKKTFVFEKFTIPDKKELVIDLWERNGDRNLAIAVSGQALLDAKKIAE